MGSKSAMPAARLGDIDTGHPPSPPTPIIIGSSNVLINSRPAARKGDMLVPHHPGIRKISEGSSSVLINGKPAARMLDGVNCGGKIIIGSGNVFIGDNPKTGGGGGVTSNIKVEQEFDEYIDSKFKPENQKLTDYQWSQLEADLAVKYRGSAGAVAIWAEYYQEAIPEGPPQSAAEAEGLKIAQALNSASELDEPEAAVYSEEVQAQVDKAGQALAQAAAQLPEGEMIPPEMVHVAEQALAATGYVEQPHSHNHQASKVSDLASRKGVPPTSLDDAANRLQSMGLEIKEKGYQPKYSDAELIAQAKAGDVAKERFHVRFMESGYQWNREDAVKSQDNLTGMLGLPLKGKTGEGAKYWSTTFDQIEDADTDAELICGILGLDYKKDANYMMVVVDTEKAAPITGVASVSATFENVSEFANRELPDEFPKDFTDLTMNDEYQKKYNELFSAALQEGAFKNKWKPSENEFSAYLERSGVDSDSIDVLTNRLGMHKTIGNNQYYEGNGLTKNKSEQSDKKYGVVETLNFERKKIDLQNLKDNGAIKIMAIG